MKQPPLDTSGPGKMRPKATRMTASQSLMRRRNVDHGCWPGLSGRTCMAQPRGIREVFDDDLYLVHTQGADQLSGTPVQ